MPASEKSALEAVKEADAERIKLEKLAESLVEAEDEESQEYLMEIYERLDEIGAETAEAKASHLLKNLGFTKEMQAKKCKDFSGTYKPFFVFHLNSMKIGKVVVILCVLKLH